MDIDIQNNSGSLGIEFIQIIKDFSQYLSFQQQTGNTVFSLSKESEDLIKNWDILNPGRRSSPFTGYENTAVFILGYDNVLFKGRSGELMRKILAAMNLSSDSVFICNEDDLASVDAKIKLVSPKVIITLGTKAGQSLLKLKYPLEQFRGRFHDYHGIKVMPTFHPSMLLKKPELKRKVWEDMKQVMDYAGLKHDS